MLSDLISKQLEEVNNQIAINNRNIEKQRQLTEQIMEVLKDQSELKKYYNYIMGSLEVLKVTRKAQKEWDSDAITQAINGVVSYMFPNENYKFKLHSKVRGKYTYTDLVYANEDMIGANVSDCNGLSMQTSIAIASICIVISLCNKTPFIFLDECLNNNDAENTQKIVQILELLASLGLQIIIVEQQDSVTSQIEHTEYNMQKINGESRVVNVRRITNEYQVNRLNTGD